MKKWINKDVSGIKVTVIIPVYNVERYLKKCLDSVISQSHKNLQIIIVDDGSTDGSALICDQYAQKDSRIHVIHKKNGGLSSARNAALDISEGDYIIFVDSDDWLPKGAIKREVQVICGEHVELLSFKYGYSFDGYNYSKFYPTWKNVIHLNREELVANYFFPKKIILGASACNKMYHANVWKTRRFREGILYEDDNIMLSLLLDINKAAFLNEFGYVQYKRPESITQSDFNHKKMILIENVSEDLKRIEKEYGRDSIYYTYAQIKMWEKSLSVLEDIQEYQEKNINHKSDFQIIEDAKFCVQIAEEMERLLIEKMIPKECEKRYENCQRLTKERVAYFRTMEGYTKI